MSNKVTVQGDEPTSEMAEFYEYMMFSDEFQKRKERILASIIPR